MRRSTRTFRAVKPAKGNPFCAASAIVVPWNATTNVASMGASQTYAVYLWTNATSSYAARLTGKPRCSLRGSDSKDASPQRQRRAQPPLGLSRLAAAED